MINFVTLVTSQCE